ncbi:AAEL003531-PA [Aedes aegypti]|uniref:AAEL003531-PA n=1 Tax=Aedes aegypti TaxID=7159 RepID=Q0IG55_AEDAE|nr:AAEL003531-PA [Aedes aegypti]
MVSTDMKAATCAKVYPLDSCDKKSNSGAENEHSFMKLQLRSTNLWILGCTCLELAETTEMPTE